MLKQYAGQGHTICREADVRDGSTSPDVAGLYRLIGESVRRLREGRDVTQEQLAAKANVSRVSITQFENGRQRLPLEALYLVASALDVGIEHLLPTLNELTSAHRNVFEQLCSDPRLSDESRTALEGFFESALKQEKK